MTAQTPAPLMTFSAPSGDPLPLLPVWRRVHGGGNPMMVLYTSLRAKVPTGQEYLLVGGLNMAGIYDFCGGCFVTSFNARASGLERRWLDPDQARRVGNVPNIEDYLGPDWYALVQAAYGDLEDVGGPYARQTGVPGMLARFVGASVFARMMLTAGASNQNIISFWDKSKGSTREWLKYGVRMFKDRSVRAPKGYATQLMRGGTWGVSGEGHAGHLYLGHATPSVPAAISSLADATTVQVHGYSPGRVRTNPNSGNAVSAGQVFLTSSAPWSAPGCTAFKFSPNALHDRLNKDFCGEHIHYVGGVTQNYWYSMG